MVGADFHSEGGAWKSIYQFFKDREQHGKNCLLVNLRRPDGLRQWIMSWLYSPRIIVNGMSAALSWPVLLLLSRRKDIPIYLHDTTYMLDSAMRNHPRKYRRLARLLATHHVLCTSQQMADLYKERFGSRRTTIVYEVTDTGAQPTVDPGKKHIVMVGSVDRRKGFLLFCEVAELAASRGLPWQFHWVGSLAEAGMKTDSPHIKWWGWKDTAGPILDLCDLFLLSSVDDPQPLACLEALARGMRAVVYSGTGSSEVVEGCAGCRVYREYTKEAVLTALQEALSEEVDQVALKQRMLECCGVEAFLKRVESVFSSDT